MIVLPFILTAEDAAASSALSRAPHRPEDTGCCLIWWSEAVLASHNVATREVTAQSPTRRSYPAVVYLKVAKGYLFWECHPVFFHARLGNSFEFASRYRLLGDITKLNGGDGGIRTLDTGSPR